MTIECDQFRKSQLNQAEYTKQNRSFFEKGITILPYKRSFNLTTILFFVLVLLVFLAPAFATSEVYTWANPSDGFFHEPQNWKCSSGSQPVEFSPYSNFVIPSFNGEHFTISYSIDVSILLLEVDSPTATLHLYDILTADECTWSGGTLNSNNLLSCDNLIISKDSSKTLSHGSSVTTSASLTFQSPVNLNLQANSLIRIASSTTASTTGTSSIVISADEPESCEFINLGSFYVSSPSFSLAFPFLNRGTFIIESSSHLSLSFTPNFQGNSYCGWYSFYSKR
ncbi:hypothetical protein GEMRC1_001645 [Eukaryota sp. GEM-RC1]